MGAEATEPCPPGGALRVSTGAMMPPDADAVVIVEHTEERGPQEVAVHSAVVAGQSTVSPGEDMHRGDPVFDSGHRLRGSDVGVLTGVGRTQAHVFRRARVGVVATGDEIVEPGQPLPPGRVRNVNQYMMASMAERLGNAVQDYGVIADTEQAFADVLERAQHECDVLFISGGSSMGTRDLTEASIRAADAAEILFHGVAIAPGKPTILARVGSLAVMGLPGNPGAAAVVFSLFGTTLIRTIEGEPLDAILLTRPRVRARLGQRLTSTPGREDYVRVRLVDDGDMPVAQPLRGKSVAISTIARAHGLIRIPLSTEGLEAGHEVDVVLL